LIGKLLAHYEITAKIGEGGMGEVYLATDKNLDREVALKILPEALAADAEREARFEREAKLLASLSHPNIAGIYGLHQSESPHFLAMEYVPGEDLAEILLRGAIAVDDAVPIALQIAEALEFAHEHGIIHRDLKPANVRLTPDRETKVLDFGLAKAVQNDPDSSDPHQSPTLTAGHTRAGVILGTAAYMSPEQARGALVDRRADIWAFGCVLFEMLGGRRAFAGDTVTDIFVSVLSHEPDWTLLPLAMPPAVRRMLARCLDKDPLRRLRDIGEARVILEDVASGKTEDVLASPERTERRGMQGAIGAVVVGAILFAAGYFLRPPHDGSSADGISHDIQLRRLTFSEGLAHEPTLSPDGNYVAYTSDQAGNLDIAILPLAGGNINHVVDHPADDAQPRWSPDGSRLAFVSARDQGGFLSAIGGLGISSYTVSGNGGDIFLMPAMGGGATKLTTQGCYPSWSPDGSSIAFLSNRGSDWDLWRVPSSGGEPVRLTDDAEIDYQPAWSPDGRWIAFGVGPQNRLCVIPAGGGPKLDLFIGRVLSPAWSKDGAWIYFSSDRASTEGEMDLWRIPFRPGKGPVEHPQRVTIADGKELGAAISADGKHLVFGEVREKPDIWRLDLASGSAEQVTSALSSENLPHLSPDGRTLLFDSDRGGSVRIWTLDLVDRNLRQIESSAVATAARWSPDGSRICYTRRDENGAQLVVQRLGDIQAKVISTDGTSNPLWSRDGSKLVGYDNSGVWIHDLEAGTSTHLVDGNENSFSTFSPDGRQVAFQRQADADRRELWAVSAEGGEPWLIAGGDVEYSHPQWNPADQDEILVVVDHKYLAIIHISTRAVEHVTSTASSMVLVDYPSWTHDGKQIYFIEIRRTGDLFMIDGL
jgi:Tol biopolymer transport system component